MATATRPGPKPDRSGEPVLVVTKYDLVTAFMIAIGGSLLLAAATLIVIWLTNRIPEPPPPPDVELVEFPGGDPEGAPDETLNVESPEDPTDDPSVAEEESEETDMQEVAETVMEVSDQATQILQEQNDSGAENTGKPGSAVGTGRKPLGLGNGKSGFPREQRWFVNFAEKGSLTSYAKQLDFFKIELGVVMPPPDGKLVYMSAISTSPKKRETPGGKGESRLFMSWAGDAARRAADIELFKKINVDATPGTILHFYDRSTEAMMLTLERDYAGRLPDDIRRTYFQVKPAGSGYEFVVTKQTYTR